MEFWVWNRPQLVLVYLYSIILYGAILVLQRTMFVLLKRRIFEIHTTKPCVPLYRLSFDSRKSNFTYVTKFLLFTVIVSDPSRFRFTTHLTRKSITSLCEVHEIPKFAIWWKSKKTFWGLKFTLMISIKFLFPTDAHNNCYKRISKFTFLFFGVCKSVHHRTI
jgi:hypothetical protein